MEVQKLQSLVLDRLHKELPEWLTYHNAEHTENVIKHSIELGELEGLKTEELQLLQTAAIIHDSGFLVTYENHEEASCDLAKELLPQYGYNAEQIDAICEMIVATRLPQGPQNKLSQILCDADVYYLGTDDYGVFSSRLYRELKTPQRKSC